MGDLLPLPLRGFGPGIWLVDGAAVEVAGFAYPTRMAVIRLRDGGVLIWSPVALSPAIGSVLRDAGEVRHLVAPNGLHDRYLAEWRAAYPQARTYAAPGLKLDGDYVELGDASPPEWTADLDQVVVRGNRITTEVVFFHKASGTVLFTDLIQQFPRGWFRGWRALVARLDLMTESEPAVPRKFRLAFTDRQAGKVALSRILEWPSTKVVMAHGEPVRENGRAFIQRAFRWLAR